MPIDVFLLTPLREGRPCAHLCSPPELLFLLTPLREGRPHGRPQRGAENTDFYSRPCGRGDNDRALLYEMPKIISTHAPAGGATSTTFRPLLSARISTHAPAGGATWAVVAVPVVTSAFLLTSLREGRHVALPRFFCIALTFLLTSLREGRLAPRTR